METEFIASALEKPTSEEYVTILLLMSLVSFRSRLFASEISVTLAAYLDLRLFFFFFFVKVK